MGYRYKVSFQLDMEVSDYMQRLKQRIVVFLYVHCGIFFQKFRLALLGGNRQTMEYKKLLLEFLLGFLLFPLKQKSLNESI